MTRFARWLCSHGFHAFRGSWEPDPWPRLFMRCRRRLAAELVQCADEAEAGL